MKFGYQKHDNEEAIPVCGRINAEKAAHILGFEAHDIPVLVRHGLLDPLGDPARNAPKYFALVYVLAFAEDPKWLNKATQVMYEHWNIKNANRTQKESEVAVAA